MGFASLYPSYELLVSRRWKRFSTSQELLAASPLGGAHFAPDQGPDAFDLYQYADSSVAPVKEGNVS